MQSKTEGARYVFAVKEFGDGTPWIMLEPSGQGLSVVGDGFLALNLRDGTTLHEAEELARLLRNNVSTVTHTRFR